MNLSCSRLFGTPKTKLLLIMQLTGFLLTICCLTATAKGTSQITLKAENAPLKEVFSQIHQQSGFDIFYNGELIREAGTVTVNLKGASLEDALEACLSGKDLAYQIKEKTVVIKPRVTADMNLRELSRIIKKDPPVTGVVRGPDGEPLAGVNVVVKGTKRGTVTDKNGRFIIDAEDGTELEISSIGFGRKVVSVSSSLELVVALEILSSVLDEVQYVAYGTTSKRLNPGSVSTVKATEIEKQPVNNPLLALQGRAPGLFITQASGLPGTVVNVKIQGQNSIGRGSDPLYVIDGVPYSHQLLPTLEAHLGLVTGFDAQSVGNSNPFNFINPADIESVDILKDADATAIYGSRAGNGAILITTKKGKAGKTTVNFNIQNGWGKITRFMELLNTQQYLQMRREALSNDNVPLQISDWDIDGTWDTTRYTDWQKELLGGTSKYRDVQASVSGGTDNTRFFIGSGYHRETTISPGNFFDRKASVHFNLSNISVDKKLRIELSALFLNDNRLLPSGDFTEDALRLAPNAPNIYNEDGSLNWKPFDFGPFSFSTWTNPLARLYNENNVKTNNLISNATISYGIFRGLEIMSSFGYTNLQSTELLKTSLLSKFPEFRAMSKNAAQYANNFINSWIVEPRLKYDNSFVNGSFEVLVGATFNQKNSNGARTYGIDYPSDAAMADIRSAGSTGVSSTTISTYKYSAVFGRVSYNWMDKYIANINIRKDGSSRFGPSNTFHNFGSVGLAWIFSKERFIETSLNFVSFGKLRSSYGITGNDQIGEYQFLNLYGPVSSVQIPYGGTTALEPAGLPNPNLQWEKVKKLQFGLELGFFNDRIFVEANYYRNRSSNQLLPYSLPITTGYFTIPAINFPAIVQNTGWELSMTSTNFHLKDIAWITNFNLTIPRNKLVDYPELATSVYKDILAIGAPITRTPVFEFNEVDPVSGLYTFVELDGSIVNTPSVKHKAINIDPKFYGGFQNKFRYRGFELDILFQFVNQVGSNHFGKFSPGTVFSNQPLTVLNHWKKPGDSAPIQRYSTYGNQQAIDANFNAGQSDAAWSDASYVRLKNLSISYQIHESWRKKAHLKNCKLFIHGQNLLTITNYQGMDPENQAVYYLPPLKIFTVGLNVEL